MDTDVGGLVDATKLVVGIDTIVLHHFVGEVIERLENENLEEENRVITLCTGGRFSWLLPGPLDELADLFPVHCFVEFDQGITGFIDQCEAFVIIEESELSHGVISEKDE
jgi:hypothetical protein